MKILLKLFIIFMITISSAQAATTNILVLPADLLNTRENYYGFNEASEIVASDIIAEFNSSEGKISSLSLFSIREKLSQNNELKNITSSTLDKFKRNDSIDYKALKQIGNSFSCDYVLLTSSYVTTNKNSLRRNLWEILEISTAFDISYPYRLETSIVLIDTINEIVLWSNHYSTKIGNNDNYFEAKNYAQANEILSKLRFYLDNVVAESAYQNIILRLYPKSLRTLNKNIDNSDGGALKFDKTIPQFPQETDDDSQFFGDMIYGI